MRGKVRCPHQLSFRSGITPAYAGKRLRNVCRKMQAADHPRLCGEKDSAPFVIFYILGSPPPMRGKVLEINSHYEFSWITPAYAGKRLQN